MELKDYIKTTIVHIVDAFNEANEEIMPKGAALVSSDCVLEHTKGRYIDTNQREHLVIDIDFETTVTVSNDNENGGGFSLKVPSICEISAGTKTNNGVDNLNKIKFSLPLALPYKEK